MFISVSTITLLVSGSRKIITLDSDQEEVLFFTEIVCEKSMKSFANGKNIFKGCRLFYFHFRNFWML